MSRVKSEHVREASNGSIRLGGRCEGQKLPVRFGVRRLGAVLVAADAAVDFAGADAGKALHAFDREILLVQRHEEELAVGGRFKEGRAVLLHRHGAQHAFQGEGAQPGNQVGPAAEVDLLGQRFENQQLADVAALTPGRLRPS